MSVTQPRTVCECHAGPYFSQSENASRRSCSTASRTEAFPFECVLDENSVHRSIQCATKKKRINTRHECADFGSRVSDCGVFVWSDPRTKQTVAFMFCMELHYARADSVTSRSRDVHGAPADSVSSNDHEHVTVGAAAPSIHS